VTEAPDLSPEDICIRVSSALNIVRAAQASDVGSNPEGMKKVL
jgi:hypothetical protein